MMAAYVGDTDVYKWFEWAQDVGICTKADHVRRIVLDIGIDDVVTAHVEKYTDSAHINVRLPEVVNVRKVEAGTRIVGVKDAVHVTEFLGPRSRTLSWSAIVLSLLALIIFWLWELLKTLGIPA
jgi:hypothetical protein